MLSKNIAKWTLHILKVAFRVSKSLVEPLTLVFYMDVLKSLVLVHLILASVLNKCQRKYAPNPTNDCKLIAAAQVALIHFANNRKWTLLAPALSQTTSRKCIR